MKRLRTQRQVEAYLDGADWQRCEVVAPIVAWMHVDFCPQWVDTSMALALTFQREIARLRHENRRLRDKLKKARRE